MFFLFSPLGLWMESYLHYKNATHKKAYFFNQPDQPLSQGFEALVMGYNLGGWQSPAVTSKCLPFSL